jgi:hypothetical protein
MDEPMTTPSRGFETWLNQEIEKIGGRAELRKKLIENGLEVGASTIRGWSTGARRPSLKPLTKLADVFRIHGHQREAFFRAAEERETLPPEK